jgi:hypothetical protein
MTPFDSFVPIHNDLGTIVVAMVAIEIKSFFFFLSLMFQNQEILLMMLFKKRSWCRFRN